MNANSPLDQDCWNQHWETQNTGWDIGYASPPLTEFLKDYPNKQAAILIPGCGNAYEAQFLVEHGFENIQLIDIAPKAVEILRNRFQAKPQVKVLLDDFFEHHGQYDLILEQTFFCTTYPEHRKQHAAQYAALLKPGGYLVGVLFNAEQVHPGPPFLGSIAEYRSVFSPYFDLEILAPCNNSIKPRAGREAFIKFRKPPNS